MGVGVQVLIGVNSHIIPIFLNAGLVRIGEAGTIEDENQEPINISDILKGRAQQWPCLYYFHAFDICYIWQVLEVLNYLWYHFSVRANPFQGVCPFHFDNICNEQKFMLGCAYGKISQVWHTRPIYFEADKWTTSLKDRLMLATRSLLITSSLFMPPQYEQKISVLTHKAHFKYTLLSRQQVLIFLFFLNSFNSNPIKQLKIKLF